MNASNRMVAALAGLLCGWATAGAAQEACTVPPALKGFAAPAPAGTALVPGRAVRMVLARDARLPTAPEKTPAAGRFGGAAVLTVARAGHYRVALDVPAWVDVVQGSRRLASTEHGHAPACSGARKLVGYDLAPGQYEVQLSGAEGPAAVLMVAEGQ